MRPSTRRIPVIHPTLQPIADTLFVASALRGSRSRSVPRDRVRTAVAHAAPGGGHRPRPDPVCDAPRLPVGPAGAGAGVAPAAAADAVIAVSDSTRRDVLRFTRTDPQRITVIPEGVSPVFRPACAEDGAARFAHSCAWTGHSCSRSAPSTLASASRSSPRSSAAFAGTTTSPWSSPVIREPSSNP